MSWATHQGEPRLGQRWRLVREDWETRRRNDIELRGVDDCRRALEIDEVHTPGTAPRG